MSLSLELNNSPRVEDENKLNIYSGKPRHHFMLVGNTKVLSHLNIHSFIDLFNHKEQRTIGYLL